MKLRGVNLGGWLVLERWITPRLFEGLEAQDEESLCVELGDKKEKVLLEHRRSFITEADFHWIAETGLNAIRIPVNYGVFGNYEPYVSSIDMLNWAVKIADKYRLKVVIDLHGAPDSQNGHDHSGRKGVAAWHKQPENIDRTIEVIAQLADRYKNSLGLAGIELLNEPNSDLPKKVLKSYYQSAYTSARHNLSDDKAVIISDSFRPKAWRKELTGKNYKNVWLDMHLYQCFDKADKKLDVQGHLNKTRNEWANLIESVRKERPVMIGEWSLGLDGHVENEDIKAYAKAQLDVFNKADGWFFWTYKTEEQGGWNFRHCVETGLIPSFINY